MVEYNRRRFLKISGTVAGAGMIAGCSSSNGDDGGDGSNGDDGGDGSDSSDGGDGGSSGADQLEPPWTTEDLAQKAVEEEGAELTIYAGTGDAKPWQQMAEVIGQEWEPISVEVFAAGGGEVSQRVIQERQADRDQADVVSQIDEINEMILAGDTTPDEWYETNMRDNYWFSDTEPVQEGYAEPWYLSALNGGPSLAMGVNPVVREERGLDRPKTWNSFFDDQYKGVEVLMAQEPNMKRFGWICQHHAEQRDQEPTEWFQEQMNHLEILITEQHTPGARLLGQGTAPFMHHNYPWVLRRFSDELDLNVVFPEGVASFTSSGIVSVNSEAPNPWTARYFVSALWEEVIQKKFVNEIEQMGPGRLDIDYSDTNPNSYTSNILSAEVTPITFQEEKELVPIGQRVVDEVLGTPSIDVQ